MKRVSLNLEYIFKASPAMIYKFLTTPSCLVRWFCDSVDINKDVYTFAWQGSEEDAEMLDDIEEERIRFRWTDNDDEEEFLEFKMYKSPVTNETVLEVIDFCDDDEVDAQTDYWNNTIQKLKQEIGG